jgi:hypothetical protein
MYFIKDFTSLSSFRCFSIFLITEILLSAILLYCFYFQSCFIYFLTYLSCYNPCQLEFSPFPKKELLWKSQKPSQNAMDLSAMSLLNLFSCLSATTFSCQVLSLISELFLLQFSELLSALSNFFFLFFFSLLLGV